MATKAKFQAIRGTRDLLPPDTALWHHVEQTAHEVFRTFGFGEIRPPIFEQTELFKRSIGKETDVVSKEMYSFDEHPIDAPAQFSDVSSLSIYLSGISAAIDDGQIVRTDENKQYIDNFKQDWEKSGQLSQKYRADPSTQNLNAASDQLVKLLGSSYAVLSSFSLRPEATASVCRAYIEHNMQQLPQPVKLYYIGPMFRRERPQKGRYRQFYQVGAEVLEVVRLDVLELFKPDVQRDARAQKELAKDATVDAELIEMLMVFFDRLSLQAVELNINSIGHAAENCRRGYVELLRTKLREVKDRLGADSQRRIETNPLRVLDSKEKNEQSIIATLPKIADHLCDDCKAHYAALKRQLELRGVLYKENWRLVRGLDYYMRTTFEITAQGLGSQDAVCGGGRYDGLVELLGGPPTKGIGFAIGEDRLILSLQAQAKSQSSAKDQSPVTNHQSLDVFIAWMGEHAYATAIRAAKDLRKNGISVELPPTELKFGKALERASKLNSRFALILGDNEVSEGLWTLKNLADGKQEKYTEPDLLVHLKKSL